MTKAKLVTDISNKYFTNNKINIGTTAPTSGTYKAGDMVISSAANSTAFGWICTAAGTPGTWKVLQSGTDISSVSWGNVSGKPSTFAPTIGTTSTTAFRGDYGNTAYTHSQSAHAPTNAQKNSDITKAEIEAKLTGNITSHLHSTSMIPDTRDNDYAPKDFSKGQRADFKNRTAVQTPQGTGSYCVVDTIKGWNDSSGGNAFQVAYGSDGGTIPYLSIRSAPCSNPTWGAWHKIYTTANPPTPDEIGAVNKAGGNMNGNLGTPGVILWNNQTGLKGYHTNGSTLYNITGVDSGNNIYLGWGNETYVNINNTVRAYRDIHMQSGTGIYTPSIKINNGGQWNNVKFGPNHVRLEYSVGDCLYVAGSETVSGGYGTPFRAKHLEAVDNWIKFGGTWLTVQSSAPSASTGDIWIQS